MPTHDAPRSGEGAGCPPEADEALLRRVKVLGLAIEIMCFDSLYTIMSSLSTRITFYV
jgi:hypothetical protein